MTLHSLAQAYVSAKALYMASIDRCASAKTAEETVAADMAHRPIKRAYFDAEEAYHAALDAEAERIASERTAIHMTAAE